MGLGRRELAVSIGGDSGALIRRIEIQPQLGTRTECLAESPRGVRRDATPAGDDLADQVRRAGEEAGQLSLGPAARLEFLAEKLARREGFGWLSAAHEILPRA